MYHLLMIVCKFASTKLKTFQSKAVGGRGLCERRRGVRHAGTYPAHHVHVGGGHVGVLLSAGGLPSHLCQLAAFMHLSDRRPLCV